MSYGPVFKIQSLLFLAWQVLLLLYGNRAAGSKPT